MKNIESRLEQLLGFKKVIHQVKTSLIFTLMICQKMTDENSIDSLIFADDVAMVALSEEDLYTSLTFLKIIASSRIYI